MVSPIFSTCCLSNLCQAGEQFLLCVCAGGADEQHRAGAELPATDQQHRQPVQPAAFLEHV